MRTRTPYLALTLTAALLVGACSTDSGSVDTADTSTTGPAAPTTTRPDVPDPEPPLACTDEANYAWYGASKAEAIAKAEAEDRVWRIGREDGESFAYTDDHLLGRVTFQIDDGVVTFATVEVETGIRNEGAIDPSDATYMGLTRAEAEAAAEAAGVAWRTVRVNDESFVVTADYSEDRRNFEVDGEAPCDVVTVITRG